MQARYIVDDKLQATDDVVEIRAAIAANHLIWIELKEETAEAHALLCHDLKIHPLTVEDVWAERSSPKIDDFDHYLYVMVHGVASVPGPKKIRLVELDVIIGQRFLVTRDPGNLVGDALRTELDHSTRILARGIPWIAHAALDHAVDQYLPVIDELDDDVEELQDDVLDKAGTPAGRKVLARILAFKRTMQELRRVGIHQREILLKLSRGEYGEIPPEALPFYRDVYDHFLRIADLTEGYRDLITSALDAYLSVQSNRMNEIMKTLTLISTVMLPLTFIAGLYGMNFKSMPELEWSFGYPMALGLMGAVAIGILMFFRHKGWVGHGHHELAIPRTDYKTKAPKVRVAPPPPSV
ncbi:MAG: magnesium/cobalt transporter CorA [Proteobacteria bacterium]|nr:magnesium/cobalt transporter CorA [Pseudomonadota bacterium]